MTKSLASDLTDLLTIIRDKTGFRWHHYENCLSEKGMTNNRFKLAKDRASTSGYIEATGSSPPISNSNFQISRLGLALLGATAMISIIDNPIPNEGW